MSEPFVHFGKNGEQVQLTIAQGFEVFFDENVLQDIQAFIDSIQELRPEEAFYFGFWRMSVRQIEGAYRLCEWDFENERFDIQLGRSVCLWHAQRGVVSSQGLPWTSVGINEWLHFTPSVFQDEQDSTVEGVRDTKNVQNGSGWLLYTASDMQKNLPFESMQLHEALKILDVNILRFLCLPDGWTFNLEADGQSHIWEEALAESPPN